MLSKKSPPFGGLLSRSGTDRVRLFGLLIWLLIWLLILVLLLLVLWLLALLVLLLVIVLLVRIVHYCLRRKTCQHWHDVDSTPPRKARCFGWLFCPTFRIIAFARSEPEPNSRAARLRRRARAVCRLCHWMECRSWRPPATAITGARNRLRSWVELASSQAIGRTPSQMTGPHVAL